MAKICNLNFKSNFFYKDTHKSYYFLYEIRLKTGHDIGTVGFIILFIWYPIVTVFFTCRNNIAKLQLYHSKTNLKRCSIISANHTSALCFIFAKRHNSKRYVKYYNKYIKEKDCFAFVTLCGFDYLILWYICGNE